MNRFFLLLVLSAMSAHAAIDVYDFSSPAEEARFQALSAELRCPKCLNTNLSGSDSPIAADLRRTVARMVREGYSDQEIRDYLLERYGDFILYRPRLTAQTLLLWFGPALLLAIGALVVFRVARSARDEDGPVELDDVDRARLDALGIGDGDAKQR